MNKTLKIIFLFLFALTIFIPEKGWGDTMLLPPIRIDFLPAGNTVWAGYLPDYGEAYSRKESGYTYGWSWDLDHTAAMCKRNNPNTLPIFNTLCQIRYHGRWEFEVPNGNYLVEICIGDPDFDSTYTINIEGITCVHNLQLPAESFKTVSAYVEVNDGKLTINAGESPDLQTRIAYLLIRSEIPIIESPPPEPALRINFQPQGLAVPDSYLADYGQLFGYKEGCIYPYGWSKDHTDGVKCRYHESDFRKDSLCCIHLDSNWEIQVPNGNYEVTVCLGDPLYSNAYNLNVENVNYCNDEFVIAGSPLIKTMEVKVNDGRLTIDSNQYANNQTRINYLEIKSPLLELNITSTRINFQPASFSTPVGYMPDCGEIFGHRVSKYKYGWNIDHTSLTRERPNYPDPKMATLCHFRSQGKWEMEMPNGEYQVLVCIGDAVYNKTYTVNVENFNYWQEIPLQPNQFLKLIKPVVVEDGRLTVNAGESADQETQINYIEIFQTIPALRINFQDPGSPTPNGFIGDSGDLFGLKEGCKYPFGWSRDHRDLVRNRMTESDFLKDSVCHFHAGSRWEIEIPNGKYLVTVCIGDALFSSIYTLNVENVTYWHATGLSAGQFLTETKEIYVNDGVLTLDSGYATDIQTRINYIEIYSPLLE